MTPLVSSETDLLIVGAGPAGLMAAAWASRYKVKARIIDDKPARVQTGHADGLTCRTMELMESFGLSDTIVRESSHDFEMRNWAPSSSEGIERVATILSQKPGVSRFQQCTTNQGRIEQLFQATIEGQSDIRIERNVRTVSIQIDEMLAKLHSHDVYPVTVEIQHGNRENSKETNGVENGSGSDKVYSETIRAKYVLGCDGAHSWTRRQVGLELKGDTKNAIWGVMDIVPLTDFPDIRQTCVVTSKHHGGMHVVAREGRLVRLYIQLDEVHSTTGRFDRSSVTPEILLSAAQKIIAPYKLDFKICDWWSVYQVGQRVAERFSVHDRVFLAGDAIHTHSPKVGQGMNVSIQDTYNLTWKVCSVILGTAKPSILATYESERRNVALALLDVDRATNIYYSGQKDPSNPSAPREDLQTFRNRMYNFLSGIAVTYEPSVLIHAPSSHPSDLPSSPPSSSLPPIPPLTLGQRLPSPMVLNHSNARPTPLSALLPSTGQWRILIFTGDLALNSQFSALRDLSAQLSSPENSPIPLAIKRGSIEIFAILAGNRDDTPLLSLPDIFHPWDDRLGYDYERVYADERVVNRMEKGGVAYANLGIDKSRGCVVVCRPDQHVGLICGLEEAVILQGFFRGFMAD